MNELFWPDLGNVTEGLAESDAMFNSTAATSTVLQNAAGTPSVSAKTVAGPRFQRAAILDVRYSESPLSLRLMLGTPAKTVANEANSTVSTLFCLSYTRDVRLYCFGHKRTATI